MNSNEDFAINKKFKKSVDILENSAIIMIVSFAGVAELADAQASGACGSNIVWVQVPSPASRKRAVAQAIALFMLSMDKYENVKFCGFLQNDGKI